MVTVSTREPRPVYDWSFERPGAEYHIDPITDLPPPDLDPHLAHLAEERPQIRVIRLDANAAAFRDLRTRCHLVIGLDGDRLVCLNTIRAQSEIDEGDLAIIERRKFDGQMVERTAKRVRRAADGFELWPESTDPAHQEPIRLYRPVDGEEVQVIGKVLWILRKP